MARETLSSRKAVELLGIKEATLYAYVSRGMIRSVDPEEGLDPRSRRYIAEDVYALMRRKSHRRDPARAAEDALDWGIPVLNSALTRIESGRLFYRGRDAVALARTSTFEQVAELLWLPVPQEALPFDSDAGIRPEAQSAGLWTLKRQPDEAAAIPTLAQLQANVGSAAASDLRAYDTTVQGTAATGRQIIRLIADAIANYPSATSISTALAARFKASPAVFDAVLILCADHELNASSFTARVVASTGADPYAVVSAAIAALSGPKHGGSVLRVHALIEEAESLGQPDATVLARVRRGEPIPGFGHVLYPDGDPRYNALMSIFSAEFASSPRFQLCQSLADAATAVTGTAPNIDFALASLTYTLKQPAQLGAALFALGRAAGWIAHAIEQYSDGRLIRPRARYIGD